MCLARLPKSLAFSDMPRMGKAVLERGELRKELFLGELLFRETAVAFVALDDFSRYIVAWKLFATMCVDDVTARSTWRCRPRALITSPSCTGQGCARLGQPHSG